MINVNTKTIGLCLIILYMLMPFSLFLNVYSLYEKDTAHFTKSPKELKNSQVRITTDFSHQELVKTDFSPLNYQQSFQSAKRVDNITLLHVDTSSTGFISRWDTRKTSSGSSSSRQIRLPLETDGTYNFNVSWGDGYSNHITKYNQTNITHTYLSSGIYIVNITGIIIGWRFNNNGDVKKLVQIAHWGPLRLGNNGYYFYGAKNMELTTTDPIDLNGTTNLTGMFEDCSSFAINYSYNINNWNVSGITTMAHMFDHSGFGQSINSWDVSHVTDMSYMFFADVEFNQSLNSWDVSHVTDMSYMLSDTNRFNQPLARWNVSHVTDMSYMFFNENDFNQSIDSWNVSKVTTMRGMFFDSGFNQPIDSWDVSHVLDMSQMFMQIPRPVPFYTGFNQSLSHWNVSSVTNMSYMFVNSSFNQPIGSWNVSSVTTMSGMFINSGLSVSNYDQLLLGWSSLSSLSHNVIFSAGNSQYSLPAQNARNKLITKFGWTIIDHGLVPSKSSPKNSLVNSIVILALQVIISIGIGISTIFSIMYLTFKKEKTKRDLSNVAFWDYIKKMLKSKNRKQKPKQQLVSDGLLEKVEEIINENNQN